MDHHQHPPNNKDEGKAGNALQQETKSTKSRSNRSSGESTRRNGSSSPEKGKARSSLESSKSVQERRASKPDSKYKSNVVAPVDDHGHPVQEDASAGKRKQSIQPPPTPEGYKIDQTFGRFQQQYCGDAKYFVSPKLKDKKNKRKFMIKILALKAVQMFVASIVSLIIAATISSEGMDPIIKNDWSPFIVMIIYFPGIIAVRHFHFGGKMIYAIIFYILFGLIFAISTCLLTIIWMNNTNTAVVVTVTGIFFTLLVGICILSIPKSKISWESSNWFVLLMIIITLVVTVICYFGIENTAIPSKFRSSKETGNLVKSLIPAMFCGALIIAVLSWELIGILKGNRIPLEENSYLFAASYL